MLRKTDIVCAPLITMPDEVTGTVFTKYLHGMTQYSNKKKEKYPLAKSAFREALINALIHRDYSTNNPIHIRIYKDKVLIVNDGKLPDGWTVEDLSLPHASKPCNPVIANAFYRSGEIEAWGRGSESDRHSTAQCAGAHKKAERYGAD